MKYALLQRTHPDLDLRTLRRYQDLAAGGETFRARIADYLPQHDVEPAKVWKRRQAEAYYINYVARIVNFFASQLMRCPPQFKSDPETVDPWWDARKEDADGRGKPLTQVARELLVRALIGRRAYLRVEFPNAADLGPNATLADADRAGARDGRLVAVPTENVRHWKRRRDGSFEWVLEYERVEALDDFTDEKPRVTETWTCWYEDGTVRRWQADYAPDRKPTPSSNVQEVEAPRNPCGAIPLVELELPPELHVVGLVAEPQIAQFRKSNALSWSIDRTCYAMPAFYLKDRRKPPTMGAGYYLMLGHDEKFDWPAPPATAFSVVRDVTKDLVQEIHRVAEQMALAVDNNQAAAVGRSGDSKQADAKATEVVLKAYGNALRDPMERALDLLAIGRGEATDWDVAGMDVYDLKDAETLTDMALASEPLQIPSATHRRELLKAVSRAQLPHLDEKTRRTIDKEIDAGVNAEDTRPDSTVPPPGGKTGPDSSVPPDGGDGDDPSIPPPPRVPREMQ